MKTYRGSCPHCGAPVSFKMSDDKLGRCCQACDGLLFSGVRSRLIAINVLLALSLLPAVAGLWLRFTYGLLEALGLAALSVLCLAVVLAAERKICMESLKGQK